MSKKQSDRKNTPAYHPHKTESPGRTNNESELDQQQENVPGTEQNISTDTRKPGNSNTGNRRNDEPVEENSPRTGA